MSVDARTSTLQNIRSALGQSTAPIENAAFEEWRSIPRNYDRTAHLTPEEKIDLFEDRLRDYDAEVTRVEESKISGAIAAVLVARGHPRMLVPVGFPHPWLPANLVFTHDEGLTPRELDDFDGVLTAATVAIADTGSFVLQSVAGQGRRAASLVPDFHLCVVRATDVVENVPEAFARLQATSTLPTTFISGPSATADIEMTRIKGVHGPRFLHVLLATTTPTTNS